MKNIARGYVWWPNIDKDIESLARIATIVILFVITPQK